MHMHMWAGIVLHTTLLAIVGYALLFSANKTEGIVALIGRVLGIWVFALAILSAAAAVFMPHDMMHGHGPDGMRPWGPPPGVAPPPPPPGPQQPPPPHP